MDSLGRQVIMASKVVREFVEAGLAHTGASLPLWHVLVSLEQEPGLSQRQLAQRMGIHGPTLVHHLDRFEAEGLITRTRDESDRRVVRVALTPAGARRFRELWKTMDALDGELRAGLTEREAATLARLLSKLSAHVIGKDGPDAL